MNLNPPDPHLNIFAAFGRGRPLIETKVDRNPSESEFRRQKALEDNITRAFLFTLHHLSQPVRSKLLDLTVCKVTELSAPGMQEQVSCHLQRVPTQTQTKDATERWIVLINATGDWQEERHNCPEKSPRPDGWLLWSNVVVCIEAKLFTQPDRPSVRR